jgi:hypothetical protein
MKEPEDSKAHSENNEENRTDRRGATKPKRFVEYSQNSIETAFACHG